VIYRQLRLTSIDFTDIMPILINSLLYGDQSRMRKPLIAMAILAATTMLAQAAPGNGNGGVGNGNGNGNAHHGAPGPVLGAGLPALAAGGIGYGIYWLVRRRRRGSEQSH
jgi:hypothetical protein